LAGNMTAARAMHTANLLTAGPWAGDVLIVGGCCAANQQALQTAELYDPSSNTFIPTGSLNRGTLSHAATRLSDGSVLITGGTSSFGNIFSLTERELFNPQTGVFEDNSLGTPGRLQSARQGHSTIALMNGQVLISGGWTAGDDPSRTVELYTPQSKTFAYTGNMSLGRRYQASAMLATGNVLVAGGFNGAASADVYSPNTGTFQSTANGMTEERDHPTATSILNTGTSLDRQVLIAGGVLAGSGSSNGTLLELYSPYTNAFEPGGKMTTSRSQMTATLFNVMP
jgi:Kelch motif